ncbi:MULTISPECIES: hypothetical protein [Pseudoalteromonas]|uniref:Uncharacterized protein n=1 Tax=Pseudoalteromonas amylolytica TaxID=1859457 RepID=A0A1S1N3M0_9GAMM|nr:MULTISPECIES: hypothetical protein [Pseudoalteromonas]MCF6436387.1 hypothetical protein [Pseudoalteromonas sp. MMG022]OHU91884.1 hypothetical protein BFC16_01970 [Pseudoalteromonas sp. JW3]OHU93218.1 hypothetical protein BET10_01880 [Pseudoalteromonas amylolytica]
MLKAIAMGTSLLAFSTLGLASEISSTFTDKDMQQQGSSYELNLAASGLTSAAVIDVHLEISGLGALSSGQQPVCTQWQGLECTGAYENVLHSELLHEASLSLSCDDQLLYEDRKSYSEFTNEELSSADSSLSFDISLVKLNPITCQSVKLHVTTLSGESDAQIKGSMNLKNTTTGSESVKYEVIQ